jgi:circadian clock protein KaiC
MPITSLKLDYEVSSERISSGIERLDTMLDGKGYFKGSTILASGSAGTGKTSIASHFVNAACARGERAVYFAFEESPKQIIRNMRSIDIDLAQWEKKGLLLFHASRPTGQGLEMHLVEMHKVINAVNPTVVVIDPITNFISSGSEIDVKAMLTRLIDFLKVEKITVLFTALTHSHSSDSMERTNEAISSLVDTWLLVRDIEFNGERNRAIHILKSRGMPHSNQVREFLVTTHGVNLIDVYTGTEGMLTGTARLAQEMRTKALVAANEQRINLKSRELERKRKAMELQIEALRAEIESDEEDLNSALLQKQAINSEQGAMAKMRKADVNMDNVLKKGK